MKCLLATKSIRVLNCRRDTAKFPRIVRGNCVVLRKERIVGPVVDGPLRHYDVWGTEVYLHAFLNCAVYIGECQCYNLAAVLPEDKPSIHMTQRGPVSVSVDLNAIYLNFITRCFNTRIFMHSLFLQSSYIP